MSRSQKHAPLRIFIVENHDDTRDLLCLWLEQLGHRVFSASTVTQALAEIPRADCDVLISDIGLPDGDGWELLRRLRTPRPLYAIAISGLGTAADCARSKAVGFRHHLVKPTGTEQLTSILGRAAEERVSRRVAEPVL
jgi:CheY-like chemotaxis protein